MGLKDSINEGESGTFTLTAQEVAFLQHMHQYMQSQLDVMQQHFAAGFLNHIATSRLGFGEGADLRFHFDPSKKDDNLTVTVVPREL